MQVHVAGRPRLLRRSGALFLEDSSALVFADVHLEKGSAFASRGQLLPPYDTRETLRRMALEIEALAPRLVVMLGDAFHDGGAEGRMDRSDIETLFALARGRALIWVVGNHDPEPPQNLPGEPADELQLSGLLLRHEPEPDAPDGETAGHLHPLRPGRRGRPFGPPPLLRHRRAAPDPARLRRLCRRPVHPRPGLRRPVRPPAPGGGPRRPAGARGGLDLGAAGLRRGLSSPPR